MKKVILMISGFCGLFAVGFGLLFGIKIYFEERFPSNLWINGQYCTGMTVDEVDEMLSKMIEEEVILVDREGKEFTFGTSEILLRANYKTKIQNLFYGFSDYNVFEKLGNPRTEFLISPALSYDNVKLQEVFEKSGFADDKDMPYECQLVYVKERGYSLLPRKDYHIDKTLAINTIQYSIINGLRKINMEPAYVYNDITEEERKAEVRWDDLNTFFYSHQLSYDMGTEYIGLSKIDLSGFVDESDWEKISINHEAVKTWLQKNMEKYNTVNTKKHFLTTRGDYVDVDYVTYGTEIDMEQELEFLIAYLENEIPDVNSKVPFYKKNGFARGIDDIGTTYIEIDMTLQHLYYYQDGVLSFETDIVTGNLSENHGTPEGINYVYGKSTNTILKGKDYESFVNYWMPVIRGIGIHDASWRKKFGGEIYKTKGSHGCINVPPAVMGELYKMVKVGTPVIMFH